MDKEQDIKRIIVVILILIVALAIFIGIRSCDKKEKEKPVVTPTPVVTVTPEPSIKPEPTKKPIINNPTNEVQPEAVAPEVLPDLKPVAIEKLRKTLTAANLVIKTAVGSGDVDFGVLVASLEKLRDDSIKAMDSATSTLAEIEKFAADITKNLSEINDRLDLLIIKANEAIVIFEGRITKENSEAANIAINALPNGALKDSLVLRYNALDYKTYAYVTTELEFTTALANKDIKNIILENNLTDVSQTLMVNHELTIVGNNKTLTFMDTVLSGINITANKVKIDGLNLVMVRSLTSPNVSGITVTNANGVVLNNCSGTGADTALDLNGATVELTGITTVTGNIKGGIRLIKEASLLKPSELIVTGTIVNASEEVMKPTIIVNTLEGVVSGSVTQFTTTDKLVLTETQYYLNSDLVTIRNVKDQIEFTNAISDKNVKIINISNDFSSNKEFVMTNIVTINGNNHTITFGASVKKGLNIQASGIVINNIAIVMQNAIGWPTDGAIYGIQVYNAKNVVINNYTGRGADAALQVNASEVELTGTITLSGNEFGGIEVSKGVNPLLNNSILTITGALVNTSEAATHPTVWLEDNQGSVVDNGTNSLTLKVEFAKKQTYYFLDSNNA